MCLPYTRLHSITGQVFAIHRVTVLVFAIHQTIQGYCPSICYTPGYTGLLSKYLPYTRLYRVTVQVFAIHQTIQGYCSSICHTPGYTGLLTKYLPYTRLYRVTVQVFYRLYRVTDQVFAIYQAILSYYPSIWHTLGYTGLLSKYFTGYTALPTKYLPYTRLYRLTDQSFATYQAIQGYWPSICHMPGYTRCLSSHTRLWRFHCA